MAMRHIGRIERLAILYKTRVVDGRDVADAGDPDDGDARTLRYLKTYAVFNAEQLTDCPEVYLKAPKVDPGVRAAARDAVLDAIPARLEIGGNTACYVPSADFIRMPPAEAFGCVDDWKSTYAHEAIHDAARWIMPRGRPPGLGSPRSSHAASRHNQSASRKARSRSSGRYRPGGTADAAIRLSACSFSFMSACR
jgi:hypothetical protein